MSRHLTVIIYGWQASLTGHWQWWIHDELARRGALVEFPQLSDPDHPKLDVWMRELLEIVEPHQGPVHLVTHSLGTWVADHLITRTDREFLSALQVAPPSPDLMFEDVETFFPPPMDTARWQSKVKHRLLVCGDDDIYIDPPEQEKIARIFDCSMKVIPGGGHINIDSGFGPFPFALEWLKSCGLPELA